MVSDRAHLCESIEQSVHFTILQPSSLFGDRHACGGFWGGMITDTGIQDWQNGDRQKKLITCSSQLRFQCYSRMIKNPVDSYDG